MKLGRRDGSAWLLTSCFLLPLLTMSIVWLNRPKPQPQIPSVTLASVQSPALPVKASQIKDDDGDGDELLEHWNNSVFRDEGRKQLGGMAVFFAGAAALAAAQRKRRGKRAR